MFELSVAFKYLIPRWRQLSVSIISLISIFVIALVVWLIVVFFSVTQGLEKSWVQKLIALTAPVRVTPTERYYNSYYFLADSISSSSNYTSKPISEKLAAPHSDPYNPEFDQETPQHWPLPDKKSDGTLKDPVKSAFQAINGIPGLKAKEYEMTIATIKLNLEREVNLAKVLSGEFDSEKGPLTLNQTAYLGTFDSDNPYLAGAMLPAEERADTEDFVWLYKDSLPETLPSDLRHGDAVLLPKGYHNAGVLIGDRGHLSYQAPTTSTIQEQLVPIYVAGFYDPGIFPMGGKVILANQNLVSMIRSTYPTDGSAITNGINVRFDNLDDALSVKKKIEQAFHEAGIDSYWKVETYRDFEFTKDFLQQLRSERNLFTLISTIVIIVACSNIISMLIILVNNKKMEIGILRSMGASSNSIAVIFGTCGVVMGLIGSMIGVIAAVFTLRNLQSLLDLITRLQGFDAFNPVFYGNSLPNEVSFDSLIFVMGVTMATSLIAGVVPAVKACLMRPSAILRAE